MPKGQNYLDILCHVWSTVGLFISCIVKYKTPKHWTPICLVPGQIGSTSTTPGPPIDVHYPRQTKLDSFEKCGERSGQEKRRGQSPHEVSALTLWDDDEQRETSSVASLTGTGLVQIASPQSNHRCLGIPNLYQCLFLALELIDTSSSKDEKYGSW